MTAAPTQIATTQDTRTMTGAQVVIQALVEQGVEVIFGYPGGAVLPLYDALFQQDKLRHILVRHEQAAVHAAEGYARSTGKVGVRAGDLRPRGHQHGDRPDRRADGFGAAGLPDRPGADPHDRQRRLPGGGHGRHHPAVHQAQLPGEGPGRPRPGDARGVPRRPLRPPRAGGGRPAQEHPDGQGRLPRARTRSSTAPTTRASSPTRPRIEEAVELLARAERPIFYVGGGVINAGPKACAQLTELVRATGYPITLTLMGLGAFPASDPQFVGMLGMHGTYEANLAMHDCDVMVCIGARFDDRVTGRLDGFSPRSQKIHVDIDPSSINKNVGVDVAIVGDAENSLEALTAAWRRRSNTVSREKIEPWWGQIRAWQKKESYRFRQSGQHDQAADRGAPALRGDQASGHLHHHRCRPAPDVGGPALPVRPAAALDDLGRPRHHGLRLPGRDRRAGGPPRRHRGLHLRRRLLGDEHAGDVDRDAVPAAGQELHPQQQLHGHGPAVAGLLPRPAPLAELHGGPAGLREAGRGLRRRGPARQHHRRAGRRDRGACCGRTSR